LGSHFEVLFVFYFILHSSCCCFLQELLKTFILKPLPNLWLITIIWSGHQKQSRLSLVNL
jgi:hypothetical protein